MDAAERSGELKPGGTIVEGDQRQHGDRAGHGGLRHAGTRPSSRCRSSRARSARIVLRAYGAEGRPHPAARRHEGRGREGRRDRRPDARRRADQAVRQRGQSRHPSATTAPRSGTTRTGAVDIFVAGIGTGGTLSGVGQLPQGAEARGAGRRRRAARSPRFQPAAPPARTRSPGIGANFVPEILDRDVYDEMIDVVAGGCGVDGALAWPRGGHPGGISSGAAGSRRPWRWPAGPRMRERRSSSSWPGYRRAVPVHRPVRRPRGLSCARELPLEAARGHRQRATP